MTCAGCAACLHFQSFQAPPEFGCCAISCPCLQSSADLRAADQASGQLDSLRDKLDAARRQEEAAKAVFSAQRTSGRSGEVLSRNELRDIQQPILNPPAEEEEEAAGGSQGVRGGGGGGGFLGSLFGGTAQATVEDAVEEVRLRFSPAFE